LIRIAIALLVALSCLAGRADAADSGTLACVNKGTPPALRERIAGDLYAKFRTPGYVRDKSLSAELAMIAKACRERHGWSNNATVAALLWTRTSIELPVAEKLASEDGWDVAAVWKAWRGESIQVRTLELDPADLERVHKALESAGATKLSHSEFIFGVLAGYIHANEYAKALFLTS